MKLKISEILWENYPLFLFVFFSGVCDSALAATVLTGFFVDDFFSNLPASFAGFFPVAMLNLS